MRIARIPKNKEPWFAFALSTCFPGLGFVYLGNYLLSVATFVLTTGAAVSGLLLLKSQSVVGNEGWDLLILSLVVHAAAVVLAFIKARKGNSTYFESERKRRKDPYLSFFLSLLWPGFGHIYSRRDIGFLIAVFYATFAYTLADHLPRILVVAVIILISIHAFAITRGKSTQSPRNRNVLIGFSSITLLLLKSARIIAIAILGYHLSVGHSMEPTILNGDLILYSTVDRNQIHRGDVVSIKHYEKFGGENVAKRLIGLPRDTIEIRHGLISINSLPIERPIQIPDTASDRKFVVPTDSTFVLGDNPVMSQDSREVGFIPVSAISEVAYKVLWPIGRMKMLQTRNVQ